MTNYRSTQQIPVGQTEEAGTGHPMPWMPTSVIDWLGATLRSDMDVFEWGSGGSTIYIAQRVKKIISVEHDAAWFAQMLGQAKDLGLCNITSIHEPFEKRNEASIYASGHVNHQGENYETYCKVIEQFPDESFDVIIVDGRARMGCVHAARKKTKIGGYLIVDDTERARYQSSLATLCEFDRYDMCGSGYNLYHAHTTSIFTRTR